jgi:hypothetical protein
VRENKNGGWALFFRIMLQIGRFSQFCGISLGFRPISTLLGGKHKQLFVPEAAAATGKMAAKNGVYRAK